MCKRNAIVSNFRQKKGKGGWQGKQAFLPFWKYFKELVHIVEENTSIPFLSGFLQPSSGPVLIRQQPKNSISVLCCEVCICSFGNEPEQNIGKQCGHFCKILENMSIKKKGRKGCLNRSQFTIH